MADGSPTKGYEIKANNIYLQFHFNENLKNLSPNL